MRRNLKLSEQKRKWQRVWKDFFLRYKLWRVPKKKILLTHSRHNCVRSLSNLLCLFHFTRNFIFHASVAVGKVKLSVKQLRFRYESSNLSRCKYIYHSSLNIYHLWIVFNDKCSMINVFVSETQTAECRSSKPNVAGSIPVAHSKFDLRFRI